KDRAAQISGFGIMTRVSFPTPAAHAPDPLPDAVRPAAPPRRAAGLARSGRHRPVAAGAVVAGRPPGAGPAYAAPRRAPALPVLRLGARRGALPARPAPGRDGLQPSDGPGSAGRSGADDHLGLRVADRPPGAPALAAPRPLAVVAPGAGGAGHLGVSAR